MNHFFHYIYSFRMIVIVFVISVFPVIAFSDQSLVPPAPASPQIETTSGSIIKFDINMYRLRGDVSGDFSLTDHVWAPTEDAAKKAKEMEVTLFTKGQFTVGDHTAKVTELEWDLPGESVEMMSGPVMLVKAYSDRFESATIRSGSDSLPYFEAVKGDLYRLKRNDEGVGYNFEFHYKLDAETNRIVFNPLTVKTRTVVDRKHIRGAGSLSVGEPIIEELNFPLRVNLRLGWFYGVLLPVKGEGNILMRFKFSQTDL